MVRNISSLILFFAVVLIIPATGVRQAYSAQTGGPGYGEAEWGLAVAVRTAEIGFDTADDSVSSFVPMMFFNGKHFFLDGTEGGVKLWTSENFRIDLLGRLRFFDIPSEYQNLIQEDTVDFGPRLQYLFSDQLTLSLDYLTDDGGRTHGNVNVRYYLPISDFEFWPYVNLRYTGENYNSYYYGLDAVDIDDGYELSIGFSGRYHVWKNFYGIWRLQTTWFSDEIAGSEYIDEKNVYEMYLGIGFFNDRSVPRKQELSIKPYLRLAHGWATPSNLGEIISGDAESDPYNNQLTSLFYGFPLTDELFGLPLQIYLTPGYVHHWRSDVQSSIQEYVVAVKAYYTFNWPIKWRFGAAEGLSYVSDIPYVENSEMERKGYEPSELMNYLDFSLDVDLGSLFKADFLQGWFLGYSIHHRSAIFETASQFGRIRGGSNYNTVYLQYHF